MGSVCVFCGSAIGRRPEYAAMASRLGATLAQRGLTLVYGGGHLGLMGVVADAAQAAGGHVVGVMPRHLAEREFAHRGIAELIEVESMHERKALMAARADAFLALPGGLGTLDELCEILTWAQLGLHDKPVVLLDVAGYYSRLLGFLDDAVSEGFLGARGRARLPVAESPEAALALLGFPA